MRRRIPGFTFVELVVVIGILVVAIVVILHFLSQMNREWEVETAQTDLRVSVEQTMDRLITELRNATRTETASPPNLVRVAADHVQFYLAADQDGDGTIADSNGQTEWVTDNPIEYAYAPAQRQLRRLEAGAERIIASDVTMLAFDDQSSDASLYTDEVRVGLTVQRTTTHGFVISATSNAIVRLRN